MVVRPLLFAASLLLTALVAPAPAAAENVPEGQTFYIAPSHVLSPKPVAAFSEPLNSRLPWPYGPLEFDQFMEIPLTVGGTATPVSSHFWVEAKQVTVTSVAASASDGCPVTQYIGVYDAGDEFVGGWYACLFIGLGGPVQPGIYEFEVDWSGVDGVEISPGDKLQTSFWTQSTSQAESRSLYIIADDGEHKSSITVSGTSEPMGEEPEGPAAGDGNSTAPSGTTTTGSGSPPSSAAPKPGKPTTAAPQPGDESVPEDEPVPPAQEDAKSSPGAGMLLVVGLAAGALVMRRRYA